MRNRLGGLFSSKPVARQNSEDVEIEKFYTNAEIARHTFNHLIQTQSLAKSLLVIHGIGGIGKSTLLKIYRLACYRRNVPVSLVDGSDITTPIDLLTSWSNELDEQNITLRRFTSTLSRYKALQSTIKAEMEKVQGNLKQVAGKIGKTTVKTAVEVMANMIPGVGPFAAALGGMGTKALLDWLPNFLSKPDLTFYLDSTNQLTKAFVEDLVEISTHFRIILMLDTYEQVGALDNWICDVAKQLTNLNVLLTISGRNMPKWDRVWQGWMSRATIISLVEMSPDDVRALVNRYYFHLCGVNPDPKQVESIVQFARGLPIAVTTVVQLWLTYNLSDFQAIKPQVVADIADRLLEGVPPPIRPIFEAAAILRHFNSESLDNLLDDPSLRESYNELRRWPFVRTRQEGLALHDTVRDMINESLKLRAPELYKNFHRKAAEYYISQLGKVELEERRRLILEQLYHELKANEQTGMKFGLYVLEESYSQYALDFGERILQELSTPDLVNDFSGELNYAKGLLSSSRSNFEQSLSFFYCALESALLPNEIVFKTKERLAYTLTLHGQLEQAVGYYRQCLKLAVESNQEIWQIKAWNGIETTLRRQGYIFEAIEALDNSIATCKKLGMDVSFEMAWAQDSLGIALGIGGAWQRAITHHQTALSIYRELYNAYSEAIVLHNMNFVRLKLKPSYGVIEDFQRALSTFEKLDDKRWINYCKSSIGEALMLLDRWADAQNYLQTDDQYDATTRIRNYKLLGDFQRHKKRWSKAISFYKQALELATTQGRQRDRAELIIRICACLFNLKRRKSVPDYVSSILTTLQRQKAYNYLAQYYLILGHYAFTDAGTGDFQYILEMYQRCLEYALCYNQFLLDDVLAHQSHHMPLMPIIPFCMQYGERGREVLSALRNWWQCNSLEIVDFSHLLIPAIPTDKSLLAIERAVRSQESENSSPQVFIIEQIEQAI